MGAAASGDVRLPRGSVPGEDVPVPAGAVVVTDLHLAPDGDERTGAFFDWWRGLEADPAMPTNPPMLIVLGDLFDTWVGPKQGLLEGTAEVLRFLKALTASGVQVHIVPGNRDALMGRDVEQRTGARVHLEGFVAVDPQGRRAAFVHGDSLCTLDRGYQALRRVWRFGPVRALSLVTPLVVARWVARRLRRRSEYSKPRKTDERRSIRPAAVLALAGEACAEAVICGHAHEPRDELLEGAAGDVRWVVVGAFGECRGREVLELTGAGWRSYSLETPSPGSGD